MLIKSQKSYTDDVRKLKELAPAGFVAGFNFTWAGPEQFVDEFPKSWTQSYESNAYYAFDPVFYWSIMNTGSIRWSEVRFPDPIGIKKKSAVHGLVYGVIFSTRVNGKRSSISVSRSDRELSDDEIKSVGEIFDRWVEVIRKRPDLTVGQLQVLKCLRDGLGQTDTARALGIAEATVSQRARTAMKLLGAKTRAEAVAMVVEARYFD